MELTHELRENAGLQWVLERLSPLSPFGKQAARTPRWYGPGEEAALEEELDNVALAMELWAAGGTAPQAAEGCGCEAPRVNPADLKDAAAALRGVTRCLPLFHDIRGSFDREPGTPFDLVELFEIKHFLVTMEQVTDAYAKMPALVGIAFPPLTEAMALMDPEGRRLPTFSIVNSYHNDLAPLRVEKAKLEKAIRMTPDDKRGPLLEKRRVLAVQEDQLELEVRSMLTGRLMAWKAEFLANMEALGHLDLIVAKGKLALRYHCVRPSLSADKSINLREVVHPQVAADLAERGEQFTSLDLELRPGCTVITGANMGGKTVSLRSTVLSLLLCQCGFFVFAKSASLPLFHRVDLILADSGPGAGGLSSFGKEVHLLDTPAAPDQGLLFLRGHGRVRPGHQPPGGRGPGPSAGAVSGHPGLCGPHDHPLRRRVRRGRGPLSGGRPGAGHPGRRGGRPPQAHRPADGLPPAARPAGSPLPPGRPSGVPPAQAGRRPDGPVSGRSITAGFVRWNGVFSPFQPTLKREIKFS